MQTIAELFKLIPLWNAYKLCLSQHVASLESLTTLLTLKMFSVDKKNQLDVTFCILYFSSNSFSTCFGQPCAHYQELTTA